MLIDTGHQAYADPRTGELDELVDAIRDVVGRHDGWADTSRLVAHELERHLPTPDVLTAEQRRGDPERYRATSCTPSPTAASPCWRSCGGPGRRRRSTTTSPGASSA